MAGLSLDKNTILKVYDGRFKDLFQEIYEKEFKSAMDKAGTTYEHRLIDDMVASALKWSGGYVWACKNYDGDVQSDNRGPRLRLARPDDLGAARARRQDGRSRSGAWYRDAPLPRTPEGQGDLDQSDRLDLRLEPWPALSRQFDNTPEVARFAETLEKICISTVESGFMTKDLAILVGPDQPWLTTTQFLDKLDENLRKAMG